jgi:hypothetical protein
LRIFAFGFVAVIAVGIVLAILTWRAAKHVPEFYAVALEMPSEHQEQASEELLARASSLASQAQHSGRWEAAFTAEQINGWLAVDLPRNHPKLLPAEVQHPRVAITKDELLIGWRIEHPKYSGVVSLSVTPDVSAPNVLTLRVRKARAGSLPLPLDRVLEAVSEGAREARLSVRWLTVEGDPVAEITLPEDTESRQVQRVDSVRLEEGKLLLAGTTTPREALSQGSERQADQVEPRRNTQR